MRSLRLSSQLSLFFMLFLFIACASTKFSTIWKDEAYQGHPKKILVINTFPNPSTRRVFEDEIVKELKERRVDAVASYTDMPNEVVSDKNAIAAQAKEIGADTVMINKLIGLTKSETATAGGYSYTGRVYTDVYIDTQTDIYDMNSNKLVSSVSAATWIQPDDPYSKQIKSFVKDLVSQLSRLGFF
jgi:hypothetical protein